MYGKFLLKSPIYRHLTWSRCTCYLRNVFYRQMSNSTDSEFDPGGPENEKLQSHEQTDSPLRIISDSCESNRPLKAPVSRIMDRNPESLYQRYFMTPDQPENPRLLKVAIIGAPNAGKSTLINTLMGWKVNGVSKKVHTTRKNTNSVLIVDNAQIIFVDTPGVVTAFEKKKHKCDGSIMTDPERSLQEADAVGVIVDVENRWTRYNLHMELLKTLYLHKDVRAFLILNKIDSLRNKTFGKQENILLDVTNKLCDGVIGGREFGRPLEREKKKKIENLTDKFDYLEKKYGKLQTRKKVIKEETNTETVLEDKHCDDGDEREESYAASTRKNDITGSGLEKEYGCIESVENESQNLEIDLDSNSELLRNSNEVLENETTDVREIVNEMSKKYNFEKSYQSEFLARILSAPGLPDDAFPDQSIKEEVSEMKKAAEAVDGKIGWPGFEQVFLVSALDGTGIEYLKEYLYKLSRPGDWIYHSSVITDQHPQDVAKMCVIQSLLDNLNSYLPYVVDPEIIYWDIDSQNYLNVSVEIKVNNTYEMGLVFKGGGGKRLQAISSSARQALMDAFQCEVRFKLAFVKRK